MNRCLWECQPGGEDFMVCSWMGNNCWWPCLLCSLHPMILDCHLHPPMIAFLLGILINDMPRLGHNDVGMGDFHGGASRTVFGICLLLCMLTNFYGFDLQLTFLIILVDRLSVLSNHCRSQLEEIQGQQKWLVFVLIHRQFFYENPHPLIIRISFY